MTEICIGLCVFNNAVGLSRVLVNIKRMEHFFSKINVIAFYDISSDDSLPILKQVSENLDIYIHLIQNNLPKSRIRTENIANARNGILHYIRAKFHDIPFFAMMDSNHYACVENLDIHVLENAMKRVDEWDSISFIGQNSYYDSWALSYDPFVYSFQHFTNSNVAVAAINADTKKMIEQNKGELIPVYSAFHGFSIYKSDPFLKCSYSATIDKTLFPPNSIERHSALLKMPIMPQLYSDCEHRKFHLEAVKKHGARVRILCEVLFQPSNMVA